LKNSFFSLLIFFWCLNLLAYEATIPLRESERNLGDVKVRIEDDELVEINSLSLRQALQNKVVEKVMDQVSKEKEWISVSELKLPVQFDPNELILKLSLDVKDRAQERLEILKDYQHRFEDEAIRPAPIGGAINSRLEKTWSNRLNESNFFNAQFDSFFNMNSFVLENQSFYQTNLNKKFFRGDTRLVKDIESHQIRLQAGDVTPLTQGFMVSKPLGGLNIARNFSINPYRLPFPSGSQDFVLQTRSLVNYFVNGVLIKSEYLPAGNYSTRGIPLNNGLNTIVVEATNDLGEKKVFIFRQSVSINLLNEGESRFDLSYGVPFLDQKLKRNYQYSEGKLFSSFYQYGFNSQFSASGYLQNQLNHSLLGTEMIRATPIGNFGLGLATSKNNQSLGQAHSLNYQYLGSGDKWYFSHSLGLRYEHRQESFRSNLNDTKSALKNNFSANYALPVSGFFTVSVGANYGEVRNRQLSDRYGYDSTLNFRILNRHNLSFFIGRNRDEFKTWNEVAYVFLTITFPDNNDFISTFYDHQSKSTKVTYVHDNQNRLYKPKAQIIAENKESNQTGEGDILIPTPMADFGARLTADRLSQSHEIYHKQSLRMSTALVFAKNEDEWGFGISRPIPSSFVIFKPEAKLKDQKIALKSTSPYTEAQTGLLKEITFSNLLPYQYREIQLDPTLMDTGRTLKKERYVLFPTYRSAHLILLKEKGTVVLKGKLLHEDQRPWGLEVGKIGKKTFFTNREGEFFIEGIDPGLYQLKLNDYDETIDLDINEKDYGLKDLGSLILKESK